MNNSFSMWMIWVAVVSLLFANFANTSKRWELEERVKVLEKKADEQEAAK